eukprot:2727785-Alexandrium_andersonii.AAC.1
MSASLVGSEMCIRDRCDARGPRRLSGCRRPSSDAGRRPFAGGASGATAVSYTHLTLPTICSV